MEFYYKAKLSFLQDFLKMKTTFTSMSVVFFLARPTAWAERNCIMISSPIDSNKVARIAELVNFLNQLYGKISEHHFSYLIKFKDYTKIYAFDVSDKTKLEAMAKKAVELSDSGVDIWHSVNPVNIEPTDGKRGDELAVSYQTCTGQEKL